MTESNSRPVYRIADLQASERPRERLAAQGPGGLSIAELLAILLGTGVQGESAIQVGQRLLKTFKGLAGIQRASLEDLRHQRGVGAAKAAQIQAALELGYRLSKETTEDRLTISSPADVARLLQLEMSGLEQEHLRVVLLNTKNHVLDTVEVYRGSVNMAQVRSAEVFKSAVRRNATAIILVHNHPSGDPTPSPDDVALTRAILQAGRQLEIEVLDHLVIGQGRWVSMKERGLGFS